MAISCTRNVRLGHWVIRADGFRLVARDVD